MNTIHKTKLGPFAVYWLVDVYGTAVMLCAGKKHKSFRLPMRTLHVLAGLLSLPKRVRETVAGWQRKCDLRALIVSTQCAGTVEVYSKYADGYVSIACGKWHRGHEELCPRCQKVAELTYPQGWRYYPGDCCTHGVYVGGCGVDLMCPRCEYGE